MRVADLSVEGEGRARGQTSDEPGHRGLHRPPRRRRGGDGGRTYADTIGDWDPAIDLFENLHTLAPLLEQLDAREQLLLQMRSGQELTQAEIGEQLGCSPMYVSRLLARLLDKLRAGMLNDS